MRRTSSGAGAAAAADGVRQGGSRCCSGAREVIAREAEIRPHSRVNLDVVEWEDAARRRACPW